MLIKLDIQIIAPIAKVFAAFSDLTNLSERVPGIKELEVLEGNSKMELGTKWKETREFLGKEATEIMWVTGIDENKSYVVEAESYGTHYESVYTFTEKDGGTFVELTFEGTPISFSAKLMSFMGSLMKGATEKAFMQDMEDLKKTCEE